MYEQGQLKITSLIRLGLLHRTVARGVSGAWPPHFKSVPLHFTFDPPVAAYIPTLYFKNVAPPSGFWPLFLVFGPPAAKSWRRACCCSDCERH